MIHRVYIDGYKSFKDFTFEPGRLAVILGPNASGKSNLLDALNLVARAGTSESLTRAFEEHRGLPLESLHKWDPARQSGSQCMKFELDVELSPFVVELVEEKIRQMRRPYEDKPSDTAASACVREGSPGKPKKVITETCLRYTLELEIDLASGHVGVRNEEVRALKKRIREPKARTAFLGQGDDNKLQLRMETQSHPKFFDMGLDHTILSTQFYWPHHPHMAALKTELSRWRFYYLEPRELMRAVNPISEVTHIGSRGDRLAGFLQTLRSTNSKQFKNLELALGDVLPRLKGIEIERTKEGQLLLKVVEGDQVQTARVVSEGTLRLIGIAAILCSTEPATMVGYEEPENGVHPRRVRLLAEWFKNKADEQQTQFLITTHSHLFASNFDSAALFVSRWMGDRTEVNSFKTLGSLFKYQDIEKALDGLLRGAHDE